MKRLFLSLILLASAPVWAHDPHGHWRHNGYGTWNWVAPAVIGGVIGYEIARPPAPVVIQQPPVQPPYTMPGQNCSPWTQIQNPDGTITTTRTCY